MLKSNDIHSIQLNTIIESTGETKTKILLDIKKQLQQRPLFYLKKVLVNIILNALTWWFIFHNRFYKISIGVYNG